MSDLQLMGGGVPIMGQQQIPKEVKEAQDKAFKMQCRIAATNTVCTLIEHKAITIVAEGSDPAKNALSQFQTLVGKYARFLESGEAISG